MAEELKRDFVDEQTGETPVRRYNPFLLKQLMWHQTMSTLVLRGKCTFIMFGFIRLFSLLFYEPELFQRVEMLVSV